MTYTVKLNGLDLIGVEKKTKRGFPVAYDKSTEGQFLRVGETFRITDYDKHNNEYTIFNVSLGVPSAWMKVSREEIHFMLRTKDIKITDSRE